MNPRACIHDDDDIILYDIIITSHLYGHGVVLREGLVSEDPHEGVDSNGGVEILQTGSTAHGHQQSTG